MSLETRIKAKVEHEIGPQHFDLINESHMHSGPATESHFKLVVVSETFSGLSAVKRHQRLYAVLADELRDGVHALALHLYTPQEWVLKQNPAPASPDCRGGSNHE
jgi:BolA protein